MHNTVEHDRSHRRLHAALVLRVREDSCDVLSARSVHTAQYAPSLPAPRTERLSPGHLVAVTHSPSGVKTVLWRWYDAVLLGEEAGGLRFWEPSHGEVLAQPRFSYRPQPVGTRAYISAGLPGAEWWASGPIVDEPREADVELDAVADLYTEHGLWGGLD